MTYLKQKPGSLEDVIKKQQAPFQESGYQDKFKKELEKAGKGIGSMTPKEKSDFFNKVDDIKKTKSENAPTNADIERLKKQGLKPKKEDAKKVQKKNVDDKRIKEEWKPSTGKHADEQLMKDFLDKGGKVEKIPEGKTAYIGNKIKPHLANARNLERQKQMTEETVSEAMPGGANSSSRRGSASTGAKKKYRFGYRVAEKQPKGNDIEEAFSEKLIKQAYGILNDPRYKGGNYSGAVAAIEKLAKGLSKHPDVANALKRANESVEHESAFAISGVETERPTEDIQETIDAGEVSKMKDKKKEVDFKTANVSTTETIDAGEVSKMADKKKEVKFSTANVSTTEDKKEPKKDVIGSDKPEPSANLENTIRNIWNKAANETTERGDSVLLPTRNESKIPPIKPDNKPGVKIAKIRATRDKEDGPGDGAKDPTAMEKQILTLQGQVNVLKAKLENEKSKVIKPVADKETGQVPLTVGLANKLLRDKAEKESDKKEIKKEAVSYKLKYETLRARLKEKAEKEKLAKKKDEPTKGRTMTGEPASKINTEPEINYNQ